MSWMKSGYDAAEKARDSAPRRGPQGFWIQPEETQRVLFLDDEPSVFWEHGYKWNGKFGNFTPCLAKNGLADSCPLCENVDQNYSYLVGLHSIVTLTEVVVKKQGKADAHFCFQRKVFRAKMGSKDKPGILKKLERIKQKQGRLRGIVVECYRSGRKTESVGDELTVVESMCIDPDEILSKAVELVTPYIERRNKTLPGDQKIDVSKYLKDFHPWEPFNFDDLIQPMEYKQMLAKFPPISDSGSNGSSRRKQSEVDYGSDEEDTDENIPY